MGQIDKPLDTSSSDMYKLVKTAQMTQIVIHDMNANDTGVNQWI